MNTSEMIFNWFAIHKCFWRSEAKFQTNQKQIPNNSRRTEKQSAI